MPQPQEPRPVGHPALAICDPTEEAGWDKAALGLPGHTLFYSSFWARVLKESYGYTPLYLTHRSGGRVTACLPLMEVNSWMTGRRGISLPFSDESGPIGADPSHCRLLMEEAIALGRSRGWRYCELRGGGELFPEATEESPSYLGHTIDLRKTEEELLAGCASAVRRSIRTAQRSGLRVEFGHSEEALRSYYALHCLTRRRHGLAPQPRYFFEALHRNVLSQNAGFVVLAYHQGRAIAGAVFLHSGGHAIYKYGASDVAFQSLRANNLVMLEAIKWLANAGCEVLNLGRTSLRNEGLMRFKLGWGSADYGVCYLKYDYAKNRFVSAGDEVYGWHNAVFRRLPLFALKLVGAGLYRHCA